MMEEFWQMALLVLLAATVTGGLITGVAHYAVTGWSRSTRQGPSRPAADRKASAG